MLAASCIDIGDHGAAREAAAEILRISPNYSTELGYGRSPYRDPERTERQYASLREAGLE